MSETVTSAGERALVDRLNARVGPPPAFVQIGIGDDAAVFEPERGALQVVTTDSLVEGVHFRREWSSAEAIGHKALAVNLSDLAAMGATAHSALLSMALPADLPLADFDALLDGFLRLATAESTALIGGNLTRSPGPLILDVTALGWVAKRRLLRREGARPGDELWVTGSIGAAAAGLRILQGGSAREAWTTTSRECVERFERPVPRTRAGRIVGKTKSARAAIDLSDGLADAVRRLAEAAGLGAVLLADALPMHPGAVEILSSALTDGTANSPAAGTHGVSRAIEGGEDYELAFAVAPRQRRGFLAAMERAGSPPVTRIGTFLPETGLWLEADGDRRALPSGGFAHF